MTLRSITEAAEQIRLKKISPVELLRECLETIDRLNPTLNAFITVTAESALAEAKKAEQEIQSGKLARAAAWNSGWIKRPDRHCWSSHDRGQRACFAIVFPTEDADVVKKLKSRRRSVHRQTEPA